MTKQKQHVSGENATVSGSNQRSLTSGCETDYFDLIPVDLLINILSKLPVKSLVKCRCVSKQWSSIIRRPNLPVKSSATLRLCFARTNVLSLRQELLFCSAPQPQNPDKDSSSSLVITHRYTNSDTNGYYEFCSNVGGFVCRQYFGKKYTFAVISNPITGEFVTTPKVKTEGIESKRRFYLGYDPIEKQFKVLCMTWLYNWSHKYQVLTLGTGYLTWRNIQCYTIHYPQDGDNGICINGVLYYIATFDCKNRVIVCFDVMSEIFSFMSIDHYLTTRVFSPLILIDYNGKLGAINYELHYDSLVLWVLEDADEHKWSKHSYVLPEMPRLCLKSASVVYYSGEIGFYPNSRRNPFDIFYYNLEKNTIRSVVVPDRLQYGRVDILPNFVEDLNLM